MAADAVLDYVDELGGAALVLGVLGLVACLADVRQDRVLVAVAVGDMVERLGDHVGHGIEPVDGAHIAPGGLQGPAQRLGVLHGPVSGLLGRELGVGEPAPADQDLQLHLGGDLRAGDVRVERADQDVDRFVGRTEIDAAAVSRHFLDELEVVVTAGVDAVGAEGAVHRAEAAVHAAHVDQVLQHPAGDPLVFGNGAPRGLGRDARQESRHYLVVVGTGVEVHVERDEVDGREGNLRHRVHRVLPREIRLAGVEVVQRRGACERAKPPRQPFVGGRALRGPRPRAELGRNEFRRGSRDRRSHAAQIRSSH